MWARGVRWSSRRRRDKVYSKKVVLVFPKEMVRQPVIYRLSRDFDVVFNILKAKVTADEDGMMLMELSGPRAQVKRAVSFLEEQGVRVTTISKGAVIDGKKCTHCGACVAQCPADALYVEAETYLVKVSQEKCISCGLCVPACPYKAIEVPSLAA